MNESRRPSRARDVHRQPDQRGTAYGEALLLTAAVALMGVTGFAGTGGAFHAAIAGSASGVGSITSGAPSVGPSTQAGLGILRTVVRKTADVSEWVRRSERPAEPVSEFWVKPAAVSAEALPPGVPTRFVVAPGAREKFGSLVDTLGENLTRGDALADSLVDAMRPLSKEARNALISEVLDTRRVPDDAPDYVRAPLAALLEQVTTVPEWVDAKSLNRGGDVMARSGAAGLATLISYSLPLTYTSPAGVKPLVWTKDLLEATPRRLAETMDFVNRTATPDSMLPGGEGWKATVRVRLIHAQVRAALSHMPHWNQEAWGLPINQTEMAGTNVAFSSIFMDGMERLGFRYSAAEKQSVMDLWRYSGYLIGVDEPLLAKTNLEGRRLVSAIGATQAPPDADSKRLIDAVMNVSIVPNPRESVRSVNHALTRYLLGDFYADALQIPKDGPLDAMRFSLPAGAELGDMTRAMLPFGERIAVRTGRAIWNRVVESTLGRHPTEFLIPENGRGVRSPTTPTTLAN